MKLKKNPGSKHNYRGNSMRNGWRNSPKQIRARGWSDAHTVSNHWRVLPQRAQAAFELKKKVQSKFPVSRLFNYGLVRATITRKICFCWQSPETTRDTSVFLLAIGIAKNLECWHNLACSHLKAWIINITLEGKRKKKHALSLRHNRECKPYGLPWNSVFSIPTAKPGGVSFFEINLPQLLWT